MVDNKNKNNNNESGLDFSFRKTGEEKSSNFFDNKYFKPFSLESTPEQYNDGFSNYQSIFSDDELESPQKIRNFERKKKEERFIKKSCSPKMKNII